MGLLINFKSADQLGWQMPDEVVDFSYINTHRLRLPVVINKKVIKKARDHRHIPAIISSLNHCINAQQFELSEGSDIFGFNDPLQVHGNIETAFMIKPDHIEVVGFYIIQNSEGFEPDPNHPGGISNLVLPSINFDFTQLENTCLQFHEKADKRRANAFCSKLALSSGTMALWASFSQNSHHVSDKIIVTATRRSENLQDFALTVIALGERTIEESDEDVFTDYLLQLPNVNASRSGFSSSTIYVRGLASSSPITTTVGNASLAPNVAVYFDDKPITQMDGNFDEYAVDLNCIEVLRGPQGTLFGTATSSDASLGGFEERVVPTLEHRTVNPAMAINVDWRWSVLERWMHSADVGECGSLPAKYTPTCDVRNEMIDSFYGSHGTSKVQYTFDGNCRAEAGSPYWHVSAYRMCDQAVKLAIGDFGLSNVRKGRLNSLKPLCFIETSDIRPCFHKGLSTDPMKLDLRLKNEIVSLLKGDSTNKSALLRFDEDDSDRKILHFYTKGLLIKASTLLLIRLFIKLTSGLSLLIGLLRQPRLVVI